MKIMIVDDSMMMRKVLEKFTGEMGLELAAQAADGKTAISLFNTHKPDLVTLDITMPEIDGLQVLDEIMKIKPDTKVLVITAITEKSVAIAALKKGAKGYLNKPFNADSVKAALSEIIGK